MNDRLDFASKFQDLLVYSKALELAGMIYLVTKDFPKEEAFSLTNQIRRSSRSIGAQIAEAWGKRSYIKHFSSKLSDAISEIYETEHWLEIAKDCGYISPAIKVDLYQRCYELSRMLASMILKAKHFCQRAAK